MLRASVLSFTGLLLAQPIAVPSTSAPVLGTPFPGAVVIANPAPLPCGRRYRFRANAPMDVIERFYLAQARAAQLDVIGDTLSSDHIVRTMLMSRKGGGLLFAQISSEKDGTSGGVAARPAGCRW